MKKQTREYMRIHRKRRVRAKISGTAERPRLSVFRSLKNLSTQVIDDQKGCTLASASVLTLGSKTPNTVEGARLVGKKIAEKCLELKISEVVFDRSGYRFHGKVKAFADGAREAGLKF